MWTDKLTTILSEDAVNRIAAQAKDDFRQLTDSNGELLSLQSLVSKFQLRTVAAPYEVKCAISLEEPTSANTLSSDIVNAKRIFEAMPSLTPAQATDERLWTTLCIGPYASYVNARWPGTTHQSSSLDEGKGTNFINHYLAGTTRSRWRDNAISRLWWAGQMSSQCAGLTSEEALEVFFLNSDLYSSLLGYSSLASHKLLFATVVKNCAKYYVKNNASSYDRAHFRAVLKKIDLLLPVVFFDVIGVTETGKMIDEIFASTARKNV